MQVDFDPSSLVKSPVLASALGSLVGLRFAPGSTLGGRILNCIGGFASAVYTTPLLVWFLKIEHVGAISGLSFTTGVLSMVLLDAIVKGLRETKVGDFFNGILQRILDVLGRRKESVEEKE